MKSIIENMGKTPVEKNCMEKPFILALFSEEKKKEKNVRFVIIREFFCNFWVKIVFKKKAYCITH